MTNRIEKTLAEEMREAAEWLRKFAEGTTRGPWVYHRTITRDQHDYAWTVCRPICDKTGVNCDEDCGAEVFSTGSEDCEDDSITEADASWISLVHPGLAEPLASLLVAMSVEVGEENYDCGSHVWPVHDDLINGCGMPINVNGNKDGDWCECARINDALAVARAINGRTPEQTGGAL